MDAFADGVFFIEFAPLGDPQLLAQAVASALGVKEEAGRPLVETLAEFVHERHLLLIFDNCEHLVQGCAALAHALLRASAALHIVASSREPLNIAGEQIYPVPTLSLPPPQPPPAAGEPVAESVAARRFIDNALKQSEAARLFIERAMAARGDFLVNDDNAVAIAGICRQLDGIPLAIELAAACTRTMSAARIEDRLSDRFRLLAGGNRGVLPRQQTLRALIDWSYDLLVPAERTLFRHLAVFAGGFTLDAAESLTRIGGGDADAVLDLVTRLVEKSLVVFDADKDRYGFLETVREYALGRLRESAEEAHARTSHLAWVLDLVKHARDEITGPEQARCLARLDAELENVLAAHAYCGEAAGGGDADMRLADAIKLYWFNRGLLGLGLRVTTEALARPDAGSRGVLRARLLLAAGQFKSWAGRFDEAYGYLEESLAIAREAADAGLVATVLQPLGLAALGLGRRADARAYLDEALVLAREGGDPRELAAALNQIAQVERIDGRMGRADEHYRQALALAREAGDLAVVAVTLLNLAMTAISRGEQREPVVLLHETLAIAATTGDRLAGLGTLDACTALAASIGEMRDAVAFHGMAEAQLTQSGMQRDPVDTAFVTPWLDLARGRLPAVDFAAAENGGRALGYAAAVDAAKSWLMRR
jgi:predicted ATPase/Tfp pilus assembly protein PilF